GVRATEVVRHDDVAAHHHEVAGYNVVGVRVGEEDLLGERATHGHVPVPGTRTGPSGPLSRCLAPVDASTSTSASPNSLVVALPPRSGVETDASVSSTASSRSCASSGRSSP